MNPNSPRFPQCQSPNPIHMGLRLPSLPPIYAMGGGGFPDVIVKQENENDPNSNRFQELLKVLQPNFFGLKNDFELLEHLNRFSRICNLREYSCMKMAISLVNCIGAQNHGAFNVLVFDYVLALPKYPLQGNVSFCNLITFKNKLFGVILFPSTERFVFYFPQFSCYNLQVRELIYSFGAKKMWLCPRTGGLAYDFVGPANINLNPILMSATIQQKRPISEVTAHQEQQVQNVKIIKLEPDDNLPKN